MYLIISLVLVLLRTAATGVLYPSFQEYVVKFNKDYPTAEEYQLRKSVYEANIADFGRLEKQLQITAGVNKFTDRTPQEIAAMKNGRMKPLLRTVTPHDTIKRKLAGPSSLDWRKRGGVSSVKDQGSCGSCWAFATAGYCQSSLIINNGYSRDIDLSQQFLLQCTPESDCYGGYPAYALMQAITYGIPNQQTHPYDPESVHLQICSASKTIPIKGKQVYVYFSLSDFQMMYLLQASPIIVGVASHDWQAYQGGIMKCQPSSVQDHAVLLVGYTPEYWIVKNNWGADWGENGYIRISRHPNHNCRMGSQVDVLGQWWQAGVLMTVLVFLII